MNADTGDGRADAAGEDTGEGPEADGGGPASPSAARFVVGAAWRLPVILAAAYQPQGPDLDVAFDIEDEERAPDDTAP